MADLSIGRRLCVPWAARRRARAECLWRRLGSESRSAAGSADARYRLAGLLQQDDFQDSLAGWTVESERPARVAATGGILDIDTPAGLTLWRRSELQGPILIEYEAEAVSEGGPNDRVSDLNCFWMATDPGSAAGPVGRRTGAFTDYNSLRTYYVGLGGNGNTTTRFRRYVASTTERPLLSENDRSAAARSAASEPVSAVRIVADGSLIQYFRDDRKVFEYTDAQPYTHGWFGIRTTQSHLRIRHFRVYRLVSADAFIAHAQGGAEDRGFNIVHRHRIPGQYRLDVAVADEPLEIGPGPGMHQGGSTTQTR